MFTPSTIKAIQDIMRQDIGVDGDATRLSQMVWLIFLKILDDEDKALEIRKEKFVPTLPKKYQWRTWAGPLDGMTGDKLIDFVNNDLLPGLRELPEGGNKRTDLTRMAFQDVYNFMRKGTLLKQVINKINEIDFNASKDRHAFNEIYERLLKSLQSAGNFGEMYTPRAVTQFIVEMVDPKIGESVLDPAVGTGGFLVHSLEHLRKQVKSVKDEQKIQQSIHGVEKKPLPYMLLITNMMLHGIEEPVTMRRGNTLERPLREYTDADKVSCIVTNPPFGGTEEPGIESNFPKEFQTRETADLFLVLIMRLLKKNGRAGIVLPDGTLSGEGLKTSLRKQLLEECNLHTIVRLPKTVFAPYTGIATNLLFFSKDGPTKEVWYFEHPLPKEQKAYSMTNPIRVEEFDLEKTWWNDRKESEYAWKVSIDDIINRNYSLDIKNPNAPQKAARTIFAELDQYWHEGKRANEIGKEIAAVLEYVVKDNGEHLVKDEVRTAVEHMSDLIRIHGGLEHLENSVLRLAVSGGLVPQLAEEGTADDIYAKIHTELEAQVTESVGRKRKPVDFAEVTEEEKHLEIPKSWKWIHLGEIVKVQTGKLDANASSPNGQYPFFTCADEPLKIDRYAYDCECVLLAGNGNFNVKYYKGKFEAYQRTYIIEAVTNDVYVPFIYLLVKMQSDRFKSMSLGSAMPYIRLGYVTQAVVALPPLAEQKRIAKKVEEVMALTNRIRQVIKE